MTSAPSPVAENDWTTTGNFFLVETKGEGQNVSLSAFGSSVWLVLTPQGGGPGGRLLVSRDYGRVWSGLPSDQIGGAFSCAITATSVQTLWGTCYGLYSDRDGALNRWRATVLRNRGVFSTA